MFTDMLKNVRKAHPLVHNITNYVTVNDCANALLSLGASPIMADDEEEVEEITAISNALVINIGTLNSRTIKSMILAGRKANQLSIPVVLDPVGAGASKLRTETAFCLLEEVKFSVIRGNISEIKTVGRLSSSTRGVDADISDSIGDDILDKTAEFAVHLSRSTGAVIAVTGAADIVTDSIKTYIIRNGHPMMRRVSGTGCMLSSITGAFIAANAGTVDACAAALCTMGICGETAYENISSRVEGTSSFKTHLIDFMGLIDDNMLEGRARIEAR